MRLRLLNLTYLAVAGIASSWVLSEIYSAIVLDGTAGTARSEGTIAAVFNIPILAGILILLFTFYRYPYGSGNHKRKKQKGGKKNVSTPLILTSKKISRERRSSRDKKVQDAKVDHNNRLSADSTMSFMESTTLDVDDYFANSPEDVNHIGSDHEGHPLGFSGGPSLESLEPLLEAEVLANFGRNDQAIEVLLEAFSGITGDSDEIATQLLNIISDELDKESTSFERTKFLEFKMNEIAHMFSNERAKLSDETWQKIQLVNPTQTATTEDGDPEELLVGQWR